MNGSVEPAKVDCTLNTATDGRIVALLDGADVVCVDFATGQEKWRTRFPLVEADYKAGGINAAQTLWTGTLIVKDGVVVHASPNQLAGFSTDSGRLLWTQDKKYLQRNPSLEDPEYRSDLKQALRKWIKTLTKWTPMRSE